MSIIVIIQITSYRVFFSDNSANSLRSLVRWIPLKGIIKKYPVK